MRPNEGETILGLRGATVLGGGEGDFCWGVSTPLHAMKKKRKKGKLQTEKE